jgi:hypothetical protein
MTAVSGAFLPWFDRRDPMNGAHGLSRCREFLKTPLQDQTLIA